MTVPTDATRAATNPRQMTSIVRRSHRRDLHRRRCRPERVPRRIGPASAPDAVGKGLVAVTGDVSAQKERWAKISPGWRVSDQGTDAAPQALVLEAEEP